MTEFDTMNTPQAPSQDWMATVALILGIASCAVSCLTGIPAIVLGGIALGKVSQGARPMAIIGIVLGAITTLAAFVFFVLMMLGFSVMGEQMKALEELEQAEGIQDWGDEGDDY